jgi:hypothetical protein
VASLKHGQPLGAATERQQVHRGAGQLDLDDADGVVDAHGRRAGPTDDFDASRTVLDQQSGGAFDRVQPVDAVEPVDVHRVRVRVPPAREVGDRSRFVAQPVQPGDAHPPERVGVIALALAVPVVPCAQECLCR